MSDPLCGPSNALQNFQKHSTVDRTLQQDRLVARQSPSQGFRSASGPSTGLLDPEFEAFQRGHLPVQSAQGIQPYFPQAQTPQPIHQSGLSDWANDFQRSHVSYPPIPSYHQPQFQHGETVGGWHQEFAQHLQGGAQQGTNMTPSQIGRPGYQYSGGMGLGMGMGMGIQPQLGAQYGEGITNQAPLEGAEAFDEAAFARAFDEAAQVDTQHDATHAQDTNQVFLGESSSHEFGMGEIPTEQQIPNQERMGADIIHDPLNQDYERPAQEDPNEIARTAGELLRTVQGNVSQKFANSEFLELMRQFRDKEVVVENESIVGTEEDMKKSDTYSQTLLSQLQRLALDRDRPLYDTNRQGLRTVLTLLIKLFSCLPNTENQTSKKLDRMLQALIVSPSLRWMPQIQDMANTTLRKLRGEIISGEIENSVKVLENPPDINVAIEKYIRSSLGTAGAHTDITAHLLYDILGYEFNYEDQHSLDHVDNVHILRAREILGRAITETMERCRGFWCKEFDHEEFLRLVRLHEKYGGLTAEFMHELQQIEHAITVKLDQERQWLSTGGMDMRTNMGRVTEIQDQLFKITAAREDREMIQGKITRP